MTKTAVITGASGGLGEGFARLCAQKGYNVILVARSEDALKKLATELKKGHGISATVWAEDLSDLKAVDRISKKLADLSIDILINNAGFGDFGMFHASDPVRDRSMIAVNVQALTSLTRAVLPKMLKRRKGRILNVSSTAAYQPGPLMAVYYATKAYVLSFSLALSNETKKTGVTVTCLCPGPTKTGFQSHANMGRSRLFRSGAMDSETVVKVGFKALLAGRSLVTPGLTNKIGTFATRFAPRMMAAAIARRVQSPSS